MPKGLTELIEHILEQIALCGEHGKSHHLNRFIFSNYIAEKILCDCSLLFFSVNLPMRVFVDSDWTELADNGIFIRLKADVSSYRCFHQRLQTIRRRILYPDRPGFRGLRRPTNLQAATEGLWTHSATRLGMADPEPRNMGGPGQGRKCAFA